LILSPWSLVFLFVDDMRHRRVGRFVAGAFQRSEKGKQASLETKILPEGWRF